MPMERRRRTTSAAARVGCSGWSYRDWRGPVYPADAPPSSWFRHYAERFDTVELNSTFYRLASAATVAGWAAQAPQGFCYAVKVGQFGSHRKKLRDAASWRWAVELRDPSWLHDDVLEVLARHDVALCIHDLIAGHPWERTTTWTYLRFHGPDAIRAPYRGRYGPRRLRRVASRLTGWLDEGTDVFAYFNNDHAGNAAHDAIALRERLS